MSILVVGTVALDTIKTPLGHCKEVLGGSATYFSISARFFSPVNLVAIVGSDFPREHIQFLKKKKINTDGLIIQKNGKTFRWEGEYTWNFNEAKTLATHLNVLTQFNPKLPADYRKSKYVFLANIDPEIQKNILKQVDDPCMVICDTMNYWIENKRKQLLSFLKEVDLCFLNDAEARQLSGESNLAKAARAVMKIGPRRVVIKKGEHGALFFSDRSVFSIPAYLLETIYDPTGAGDTFAGGVVGYLAKRNATDDVTIRRALAYGTVMATFAVEDFSLRRISDIRRNDIRKRLHELRKQSFF